MDNCQLPKCYPTALNFENDETYAPINTVMLEGFEETYEIQEYDNPSGLSQNSSTQNVDKCVYANLNTPGPLDQPLSSEPKPKEKNNFKVIKAIEYSSNNNNFLIISLLFILITFIFYINKTYKI
jgi:hypothetical protein